MLTLYVRHLAWLHATPEGSKQSRLATFKSLSEDHPRLNLPEVDKEFAAGYLLSWLHEAGLMSSSGMGPVPLSWQEIESWMRCTETKLTIWERLTIKGLSEDYVGELIQAKDKDRPAPFAFVDEDVDVEQVSTRFLKVLRGFSMSKPAEDIEQKEPS